MLGRPLILCERREGYTDMAGETVLTVVGNLVDDPELRFTASGAAVANFKVASTPRAFDKASGEWKDGEPLFLSCAAWRQLGEHIAESLTKGARVIVQGRLRQRTFETKQGEKRTVYELDVDEIGPSLRYATVQVQKATRSQGSSGGFAAHVQHEPSGSRPGGFGAGPMSDEPPF